MKLIPSGIAFNRFERLQTCAMFSAGNVELRAELFDHFAVPQGLCEV